MGIHRCAALFLTACLLVLPARAQAPDGPRLSPPTAAEWIALGTRVHGGFGTFIPLGIRVGLDALKVLEANPREVDVTVFDGPDSPCPCVADGVLLATSASPGQGTLRVAAERAAPGELAVIVVRHRKSGRTVRYVIPDALRAQLVAWNKQYDPAGRYEAVMSASESALFVRELPPVR
jgi:formylmethanofuran dehydrogenase subunit E